MEELLDQLIYYLRSTWRYRWYAIGFAWLIACGGWIVLDRVPNRYQAQARVQLDTQSIIEPLLKDLAVQPGLDAIARMISRTLLSRANIEKVIKRTGLDANLKTSTDRQELINRVHKYVKINRGTTDNFYTVSYSAESPQEAKIIVEAFLKLLEEESISDKRRDAMVSRQFIDEQLKVYGEKLKVAETAVMEFKRQNVGLLPGEGQGYYTQLRLAEEELRQATVELREAENSRNAIQRRIDRYREMRSRAGDDDAFRGINPELDDRISALEKKLDDLLVRYTDKHPDISALERLIAHLKEERARQAKLITADPSAIRAPDLGQQQMMVSLSSAEARVAAMRARVGERERHYNELKSVADALPQVEAKFIQLTRDYNVIKTRYDKLLERRESAQVSGDLQETSGVLGFRVVDPPGVPRNPNWPDRPRIATLILLGALAGGFGLAFLIGQLRPTFDSERRLRELTGLPVLGAVVMIPTSPQKTRRRRGLVAFVVSFAGLLSAYAAIMISLVLITSRA